MIQACLGVLVVQNEGICFLMWQHQIYLTFVIKMYFGIMILLKNVSAFLADGDIISRCSPCDAVFFVTGDGVRAGAFTHAVELHDWNVEAHEVLQSVFGDGGSAGEENLAAVQSQ